MERIGLAPGSEIGGYTVVSPLGEGGMGTVYRAVDGGGDAVALKLLHTQIGTDAAARARLRREVSALQRLRHPGVAAILDAEADSTEAFLVTELIQGENLEEHVHQRGPLDAADLLDLAEGLRDTLEAVHGAGVIHRDLKPSNVLVTDDGPVLIDFGIAQAADDTKMTSTGLVLGTPGYLAPELIDGGEPSAGTDFWGWAAVLAFAATGRPPFGSRPLEAVLARAHTGDVDLDGVGPLTAAALRRALAPAAQDRTSPDDVVAALTLVVAEGEPVDDDLDDRPDGRREGVDDEATTEFGPQDVVGTTALGVEPATVAVSAGAVAAGGSVVSTAPPVNDGQTRAFVPLAAAGPAQDPADESEGDEPDELDPDGVDWIEDDLDASEGDGPEGSGYVRPPALRRWGTLLAFAVLVGSAGAIYPGITLIAFLVLVIAIRTIGAAVESMHAHRERVGVRRSDHARTVATGPWYLLRSLLGLLPSLVVAGSVVVILLGISWWLIGEGRWTIGGSPAGQEPQGVTASLLVAAILMIGVCIIWWGPLSRMTRLGARRVLAVVAPGRKGALIAVAVLLGVSAIFVTLILTGTDITWAPLPEPTLPPASS
ncbi:serine/threonine-protein kinase [Cellulomonas sp. URHD0024]|uniref:protein kinase domain-containing protein n=1 Tax=Cellulomonas sp. URHD0024 TaxID=1302620 RepID=UPI000407C55E|nr:serine/threonine-protein kinase [Cellulomonas sp. URHD0024]